MVLKVMEAKRMCQRQYVEVQRNETDLCRAFLKAVSKYESELHNTSVMAITVDGLEQEAHTFEVRPCILFSNVIIY